MNLEQILDKTVQDNPDEFNQEVVERVRNLVDYEIVNPGKRKPYRFLEDVGDFELYYRLHPGWEGKSTRQMQKDTESGASAFYAAFNKWVNKTTQDKEEKKVLIQQIFEPKYMDRFSYTTIDDWVEEYNKHPEWYGKSTTQMTKDRKSGGNAFYLAFKKWVKNKTPDEEERKALTQKIFEPKLNDWSSYENIDDWIEEYNKHPTWQGKSTKEMRRDVDSGASSFYHSFKGWIDKTTQNEEERKAYVRAIFPERRAPFKYDFKYDFDNNEKNEKYFDSQPERIVAILLNHYGLADDFIEGENLHVLTNGKKQHSIDFLIDKTFIEYHPLSRSDKKNDLTLKQAGERKKKNITNPEYTPFDFYHICEIDQLYDVLRNGNFGDSSKFRDLTKEQFGKDVNGAYKMAIKYDSISKQTDVSITEKAA